MSIASEITRLTTAKASLKTAIESKGVTVPVDSTLDDYADLVDSISGESDLRPLNVSENGQYSPDGFDGYSNVSVNIPFAGTLVKTVTLTEDISQYPNAWRQYLELDKGVYIAVFEGNTYATASRRANMLILGQGKNDTNSAGITVRNDWKNAVAGASVDCGASAGTVVKVYQMPTGINAS